MKHLLLLIKIVLVSSIIALPAQAQNIIATDNGANYGSGWNDGSNEGTGFQPWEFDFVAGSGFAGGFIGNPADAGISGMSETSFGLFSNPAGSGASSTVTRPFSNALIAGEKVTFNLGMNWDSDGAGSKGVRLIADSDVLITISMGGSATISINGNPMFNNYGTQVMTITMEYIDLGEIRVTGNGRDGSESFDQTLTVAAGAPDAIQFFSQELGPGANRQLYFNALRIEGLPEEIDPPAQIVLNAPAPNAQQVSLRPTLSWTADEDASTYILQVSTTSDFSSTVIDEVGLVSTSFEISAVLRMETEFFWRVRGANAGGNGDWSDVASFTTVQPKLTLNGNRNSSFGGNLGFSVLKLYDDESTIFGEFERTTSTDFSINDAFVFYLANGSTGRTAIDSEINDQNDGLRRAISSAGDESSVINFPVGFEATHAIAIDRNFGGLWEIPSSGAVGANGLVFKSGVNSTLTTGPQTSFTFRFNKSQLNISDEIAFKLVGVMLNSTNGRLSNESLNIGIPANFDAGTPVAIRNYWVYPEGTVGADLLLSGSQGWRFLSSPIIGATYGDMLSGIHTQGFTGANFLPTTPSQSNVRTFDGTNYVSIHNIADPVPAGSSFAAGVYRDDVPGTEGSFPKIVSVSGEARFGDVTATLNGENTFSLLGNPYLFPVDFSAITFSGLSDVIYIYDYVTPGTIESPDAPNNEPSIGVFRAYNGEAGSLGSYQIAPFQGFLVHQLDAGATLTFSPAAITGSTIFRGKETSTAPQLFSLELLGEGLYASTWMHFSHEASSGLDGRDALKLYPFSSDFALIKTFTEDGTGLDINHYPVPTNVVEIPLEMMATRSGVYTLRTSDWNIPESWAVTLVDNERGEEFTIYDGTVIQLSLDAHAGGALAKKSTVSEFPEVVSLQGAARFRLIIDPGTTTNLGGDSTLPAAFSLNQNFPNPFNPTTSISFTLPADVAGSGVVRLTVFDMLGREVARLVDGQLSAGTHTVRFDASGLGSGIYVYRLEAGGMVMSRRMTFVK